MSEAADDQELALVERDHDAMMDVDFPESVETPEQDVLPIYPPPEPGEALPQPGTGEIEIDEPGVSA